MFFLNLLLVGVILTGAYRTGREAHKRLSAWRWTRGKTATVITYVVVAATLYLGAGALKQDMLSWTPKVVQLSSALVVIFFIIVDIAWVHSIWQRIRGGGKNVKPGDPQSGK